MFSSLPSIASGNVLADEYTKSLELFDEKKPFDLADSVSTVASVRGRNDSITSDMFSDLTLDSPKPSKMEEPPISAYDSAFGVSGFVTVEESTPKPMPSWDQSFAVRAPVSVKEEKPANNTVSWDSAFAVRAPVPVNEEKPASNIASWDSAFTVRAPIAVTEEKPANKTASWNSAFGVCMLYKEEVLKPANELSDADFFAQLLKPVLAKKNKLSAYDCLGVTGLNLVAAVEESMPKATPSWDQSFAVRSPVSAKEEKPANKTASWDSAFAVHSPVSANEEKPANNTVSWDSAFAVDPESLDEIESTPSIPLTLSEDTAEEYGEEEDTPDFSPLNKNPFSSKKNVFFSGEELWLQVHSPVPVNEEKPANKIASWDSAFAVRASIAVTEDKPANNTASWNSAFGVSMSDEQKNSKPSKELADADFFSQLAKPVTPNKSKRSISAYSCLGVTGLNLVVTVEESTPKATPSWDQSFAVRSPVSVKEEKPANKTASWDSAFTVRSPVSVKEEKPASKTASWDSAFTVRSPVSVKEEKPASKTASWDSAFTVGSPIQVTEEKRALNTLSWNTAFGVCMLY